MTIGASPRKKNARRRPARTSASRAVYKNGRFRPETNYRIRKITAATGIITTIAGNGNAGYSDDGGDAKSAELNAPFGVNVDASGNVFVADTANHCIRKITNNVISTVAGNGVAGFSGDGGPAANASISSPQAVIPDAQGNLYIADSANGLIRKRGTNGIITTPAGNGVSGVPVDNVPANSSSLSFPRGVYSDAPGDLYLADSGANRIRKVTFIPWASSLTLSKVSAANAGAYQVVTTSAEGSVTSSVVNLTVTAVALIYETVLNPDNSLALAFISPPSSTNVVFAATNLAPPVVWQPIFTNLAATDGTWQFTDTQAMFYRSRTR